MTFSEDLFKIQSTNANDVFYTPKKLALQLISLIDIEENETILDPFRGEGAFYNNFPKCKSKGWAEITEGKDFFILNNKYDWLISNPPFSKLSNVLLKSCALSNKGFAYIIPSHSLSHRRILKCAEFGFHLNKIIYFKNPKNWGLGFQMVFALFTKEKVQNIICIGENSNYIQKNLEVF